MPEVVLCGVWWVRGPLQHSLDGGPHLCFDTNCRGQPQGAKVVISFLCPSELDSYSRYADILLGLSLLLSHLVLCYGSVQEMKAALSLFFILSLSLLVLYWVWFSYLKYGKGESEAAEEVSLKIIMGSPPHLHNT